MVNVQNMILLSVAKTNLFFSLFQNLNKKLKDSNKDKTGLLFYFDNIVITALKIKKVLPRNELLSIKFLA